MHFYFVVIILLWKRDPIEAWHKASLDDEDSNLFKLRAPSFPR